MNNRTNTYLFGASMIALTFSLNINTVNASQCFQMPTCEQMGYTSTGCENGVEQLKCPFNTGLVKCLGSSDCKNLGYKSSECSSDQTKITCPYDKTKFFCLSNEITASDECHVGDIYYSDDTCSVNFIRTKTPLGIVFDEENKLVISKTTVSRNLMSPMEDIPTLNNYDTVSQAKTDMAGKANTDKILAYANANGYTSSAVNYCVNMTAGNKTWFLPSLGQVVKIYDNKTIINNALNKIYGSTISKLLSSTEYNDEYIWILNSSGIAETYLKSYPFSSSCVFTYASSYEYNSDFKPCATGNIYVGDFYYSDDTCSSIYNPSKTAIGIVFDPVNRLVMQQSRGSQSWDDGQSGPDSQNLGWDNIPDLPDYTTKEEALADMDGQGNTQIIMDFINTEGNRDQLAAHYCNDLTIGNKDWYLPSLGEVASWIDNKYTLGLALEATQGQPWGNYYYWTSNEKSGGSTWALSVTAEDIITTAKHNTKATRCIFKY